ncbi:hypothetical protein BABINDRAFT_161782 [Babjeviella inositovora NRRL Y-12698]|uniref:Mitochondrial import inner membrane translocase subunit n=1 Tax=Babjeviella inositovora NRRL Y-12698 TaxID=984486 RepID=A0A1E3QNU7_9ASCO|nr:uncharacterized protein BABINDRAFT_161782 [Babjeviella inositovora NRRL Y-12698]ODQ79379.1 hypothetical protein BABINDRAFT_161782 [Babjeviella inositovora NRRL Y-12698]
MAELNQQVLNSLDDSSRQELMKFVEAENSKSKVQMSIHQFTNLCFKTCVTNKGPIFSGDLSVQEENCLANCVNRFLDTNIRVVQQLQNQQ